VSILRWVLGLGLRRVRVPVKGRRKEGSHPPWQFDSAAHRLSKGEMVIPPRSDASTSHKWRCEYCKNEYADSVDKCPSCAGGKHAPSGRKKQLTFEDYGKKIEIPFDFVEE